MVTGPTSSSNSQIRHILQSTPETDSEETLPDQGICWRRGDQTLRLEGKLDTGFGGEVVVPRWLRHSPSRPGPTGDADSLETFGLDLPGKACGGGGEWPQGRGLSRLSHSVTSSGPPLLGAFSL